ncbi:MAG: 50S ribosomal protein L16 [Candidatus Verstraetearchaeota archaeon]|nr:50S ribosomal protein L16 [Candidatus Verstraetearchaeota archaeon]
MPERPARCYRYFDTPPYTRKEYIKGIPQPKVTKFTYGNVKGDFAVTVRLVSLEYGQIRHNAIESARLAATRYLSKKLSETQYHFQICIYPHHVLRENRMMAFAGADRLQDGMRRAFGKPAGTAARVKPMQTIFMARVNPEHVEIAKEALRRSSTKLAMPCRIIIETAK